MTGRALANSDTPSPIVPTTLTSPPPWRASQRLRIADHHEGGPGRAQRAPGLDDDLRPYAGRIAEAEREPGSGHRVSMVAELRRSRI